MAGNRPDFRMVVLESETYQDDDGNDRRRPRVDADGNRNYIDIAAFWQLEQGNTKIPGVYKGKLSPYGRIADIAITVTTEEGEKIQVDNDSFFFNLRNRDADQKGGKTTTATTDEDFG